MAPQHLSPGCWGPSFSIWALRPQRAASSARAQVISCVRLRQFLARTSALALAASVPYAAHRQLRKFFEAWAAPWQDAHLSLIHI
eukprot:15390095-Alexandrium_andersonii.AAC.1